MLLSDTTKSIGFLLQFLWCTTRSPVAKGNSVAPLQAAVSVRAAPAPAPSQTDPPVPTAEEQRASGVQPVESLCTRKHVSAVTNGQHPPDGCRRAAFEPPADHSAEETTQGEEQSQAEEDGLESWRAWTGERAGRAGGERVRHRRSGANPDEPGEARLATWHGRLRRGRSRRRRAEVRWDRFGRFCSETILQFSESNREYWRVGHGSTGA